MPQNRGERESGRGVLCRFRRRDDYSAGASGHLKRGPKVLSIWLRLQKEAGRESRFGNRDKKFLPLNWVTAFTNRYIEMMLTRRWYTDLFHIISNKVIHTQIFMMDCQQIRFVNDLLNHQEDKGPCQSPGRHGSQGSNSSFAFGIWNLKAISISFSTMNYVSAIGESFHKHGN